MLKELLKQVIEISIETGKFLRDERESIKASEIEMKSGKNDLVSRADKEAERRFVEFLRNVLPEAGYIAEEGTGERAEKYNWIIDPLDGTTNYLFGIPCYCTSVALWKEGEILLGVIYDPERDECFSAAKGLGAFLNDNPIKVSGQKDMGLALLATGFPYNNKGRQMEYLKILAEVNSKSRGIRRLGAAAVDMAYVACGRFEGFYEYGLNAWDVAAGAIIIEEAGGKVSDFYGKDNYLFGSTLVCDNGLMHDELVELVKEW
ncbi:MAG TPA: inositol monophosphatase family protein [Cryomorphaceae bacterium]|nr:inositol monophosphatase family protein [Cryomorphaceae bacterium]